MDRQDAKIAKNGHNNGMLVVVTPERPLLLFLASLASWRFESLLF